MITVETPEALAEMLQARLGDRYFISRWEIEGRSEMVRSGKPAVFYRVVFVKLTQLPHSLLGTFRTYFKGESEVSLYHALEVAIALAKEKEHEQQLPL